ncbi:hypothetical protein B4Q13_24195, partial [Lacticaseibacillus rhamnosus]
ISIPFNFWNISENATLDGFRFDANELSNFNLDQMEVIGISLADLSQIANLLPTTIPAATRQFAAGGIVGGVVGAFSVLLICGCILVPIFLWRRQNRFVGQRWARVALPDVQPARI